MLRLFFISALAIAISAIVFALQNPFPVTVNLGFWQLEGSLALVLVFTLAVGFLVGLLVAMPTIIKRSWKIANQKKKIADLERVSTEQIQQLAKQHKRIDYLENRLKGEFGTPE